MTIDAIHHDTLALAMHAVAGELGTIRRDARAEAGARYTYASLSALLDAVRPALWRHGLSLRHTTRWLDLASGWRAVEVESTIEHAATGAEVSAAVAMPPAGPTRRDGQSVLAPPQEAGIAISYARRYGILCLLGLATDDEGGAAPAAATRGPQPVAHDDPRTAALAELGSRIGSDVVRARLDALAAGDAAACPGVPPARVAALAGGMGGDRRGWRGLPDDGFAALIDAIDQQWEG